MASLQNSEEPNTVKLINGSSTPPNPFTNTEQALYVAQNVANESKGRTVFALDLGEGEGFLKGSLTINFFFPETQSLNGFNVILKQQSLGNQPKANTSGPAGIRINSNFPAQVLIPASSSTPISTEQRVKGQVASELRIVWDFTTANGTVSYYLDGNPLTEKGGTRPDTSVFPVESADAIAGLAITPRSSTSAYIIGRITLDTQ